MRRACINLTASVLAIAGGAHAIDHSNLDGGRPLRLEDAYSIAQRELNLEFGVGFDDRRQGVDQAFGTVELLWGAAPNLQLGIGTTAFSHPHDVDEQSKSGDVRLSALYNFNQETSLPALALKGELNLPTGVDSAGADAAFTAILTKSCGNVSFHFNAGYEFLSGASSMERDGLYKFALGASMPIAAPMHTRTTLIGDLFIEQGSMAGDDEVIGAEIGVRHQLTERIVLDGGIGTEFDGPSSRSRVFAVLGLSITF